jgi:hypothetical protein
MLRLRQVALVADKLAPVVDDYHEILGLEVAYRDPGVKRFGLENAVMPVGQQFLEVVAPVQDNTTAGRYLHRRNGDGGYMVILQCDDHPPVKQRVDELGIRKVLEHDSADYCIMQLHPADTGGSFLEIDVQHGGEDMDGPWEPAGPNWQEAKNTDVVNGISAVEIQSPEPDKLAERWSAILDRPVVAAGDHQAIELDNATIRFVPVSDGRGEGLGGVDVIVNDRDRATRSATSRGQGSELVLGGVRITLTDAAG